MGADDGRWHVDPDEPFNAGLGGFDLGDVRSPVVAAAEGRGRGVGWLLVALAVVFWSLAAWGFALGEQSSALVLTGSGLLSASVAVACVRRRRL